MTTIDQVQHNLEDRRAAAERRRDAATYDARRALDLAKAQGLTAFTASQQRRMDQLIQTRDAARQEISELDRHLAQCTAAAADELEVVRRSRETYPTNAPNPHQSRESRFVVTSERRTYSPDTDRTGAGFLKDVINFSRGSDPLAVDRLSRHMREETIDRPQYQQRAAGSGNFAGLIVPQYLTNMYAPLARAMRPFADCMTHHDLPPDGMTVNIPLLTTGNTVVLQTSENNAPTGSSPNDTLLTENVQTFTGNVTISRQAIDRGTGIDDVVMQDLFNALASVVDSTVINQTTTGALALAQTITFTNATPTQTLFWPFIFQAASQLERALLQVGRASHIAMSIPRWQWLTSGQLATWPIAGTAVQGNGLPVDAHQFGVSVAPDEYGPAVRGRLGNGMLVCVDANLPLNLGAGTNQDVAVIFPSSECHLWEDPQAPVYLRAEQPAAAQLGILIVIWEYAAYSMRRYTNALAQIQGTGMIVPAGF